MSVKDVQALDEKVQKILNQDSRLDRNSTEPVTRPDSNKVKEEILKDKSKNSKHHNAEPDEFPAVPEHSFKCLGLVTEKVTDLLSLKPKPIYFKMGSHQPASVIIRNIGEFKNFLDSDQFRRSHVSALMAMSFEPMFTFNAVYHNIA